MLFKKLSSVLCGQNVQSALYHLPSRLKWQLFGIKNIFLLSQNQGEVTKIVRFIYIYIYI